LEVLMARAVWFRQSQGLATKIDPSRIQYDQKTGVLHLSEAFNIDFDFTGAIFRRKGYELNTSGNFHSLFWGGGDCVVVKNDVLSLLAEDLSTTQIRSGLAPNRLSYCQMGDSIVYMNGFQSAVVKNGINYDYTMPPETHYPDQTRVYNNPPVGHIVRSYAGRIWIAVNNTLIYSEPFGPNLFRLSVNYIPFPARITMIAPVRNGLVVSTTSKIYFMLGSNPKDMTQTVLAHYPVIEGTDAEVDGITIAAGKISPLPMQMFTTTNGICVVTTEGELHNLTYQTLEYPRSNTGCAVYTGDKYIVSLDGEDNNLAMCMSLSKAAMSQYANYDFSGMWKFKDAVIGVNANGLYTLLTGDTDADTLIPAHFRTGPTDFGAEEEKRLRKVYISVRAAGRMKLAIAGDDEEDIARDIAPYDDILKIIHQEVSGGRDIRGKYLDLKVSNVRGADFTVTEIQALLIVKSAKTTEVL
jgi:hypothetical protein